MKKLLLILFQFWFSIILFSESGDDITKQADVLIEQKKYLSAISLITDSYVITKNPNIFYYKVETSINYFAVSINHKMFGFKDLESNETIEEIRGKEGKYTIIFGDLSIDIEEALKIFSPNYLVFEAIADYYYDLLKRYQGKPEFTEKELYEKIIAYYIKCVDLGEKKEKYYANIAECYLNQEVYPEAEKYYKTALGYSDENASYNYNYAFALEKQNKYSESIIYSNKAIKYYENRQYKADAYMMNAFCNLQLKNMDDALKGYLSALKIDPKLDYAQKNIIGIYLSTSKYNEARIQTTDYMQRYIRNFDKLQYVLNYYVGYKRANDAIDILTELIKKNTDITNQAILYYHRGLLSKVVNKNQALEDFNKANELFSKVLKKDHEVFKLIETAKKE